ncbi:MAG: histone H1 [Bacteroidetes bacterium RIFCSPLOWO2_02_FULL_36_8]|nr:MAG: histone H1 [Bacteroidetes bacterium RIFCSPLOWO2_02_FULL_36_8]OFY69352.1 MAG: histone H1 [Bacteroidetes bacterium RIFCSPLOWO2_12_FULL_37_12]
MKKFNDLKNAVLALEADAEKFYIKGNNAAGTRLRKGLLDIKQLAQAVRVEVLAIREEEKV